MKTGYYWVLIIVILSLVGIACGQAPRPVDAPLPTYPDINPQVQTPPVATPPDVTPPVQTPPVQTPPVATPQVVTPQVVTPQVVPTPSGPQSTYPTGEVTGTWLTVKGSGDASDTPGRPWGTMQVYNTSGLNAYYASIGSSTPCTSEFHPGNDLNNGWSFGAQQQASGSDLQIMRKVGGNWLVPDLLVDFATGNFCIGTAACPGKAKLYVETPGGLGVWSHSNDSDGVLVPDFYTGVYGSNKRPGGNGVYGRSDNGNGVYGSSDFGNGVEGFSPSGTGVYAYTRTGTGVIGSADGSGTGVYGSSRNGFGVLGTSNSGYAGYFKGNVKITGNFSTDGTKNFVAPDPTDPTKDIYYASLEGPEAGTYIRGSANLVDGKATIQLPDNFAKVTADNGLTVLFTPVGKWLQLYAIEKTTSRIVVGEATGQSGSFDYVINGVRKGYEDFQVVRDHESAK